MKTINLRWMYPYYRHDEFVDVTDEVWAAMYQAKREMENYERRKVYHRAYYSLDAYSWLENYALEHSRSPEDILLEREEMTTRLYLIAALPVALAHATPTQARRVHAYYIAGIKQPEISRREGILENSDFIYMLNQASDDRSILAQRLNISPHQLSYVTNSGEGEGLLFYGNVILPFIDRFPTDLELYRIMTTKLNEVAQEKEA